MTFFLTAVCPSVAAASKTHCDGCERFSFCHVDLNYQLLFETVLPQAVHPLLGLFDDGAHGAPLLILEEDGS